MIDVIRYETIQRIICFNAEFHQYLVLVIILNTSWINFHPGNICTLIIF